MIKRDEDPLKKVLFRVRKPKARWKNGMVTDIYYSRMLSIRDWTNCALKNTHSLIEGA
jgi:hypothetical protein